MTLPFSYLPLFGVDPFYNAAGADVTTGYGGGAKVTGDNLLVTLWSATADEGGGPPLFVDLLQPSYASVTANALPDYLDSYETYANLAKPFASSRTAAKYLFANGSSDIDTFLAVLNPPAELKNHYMSMATAVLAANAYGFQLDMLKSCANDSFVWGGRTVNGLGTPVASTSVVFGSVFEPLPLLRTSGADGVAPVFYTTFEEAVAASDPDVGADFIASLKEVAKGNFFVPAMIVADAAEVITTLEWPHSIAR